MNFATREEWLEAAAGQLSALLPPGRELPPIKLSVGLPKGGRNLIGQCWPNTMSEDGKTHHIFIAPALKEPAAVLRTLLHEVIHALTPGAGHRGAFITLAKAVGFTKPWTSSEAGVTPGVLEKLAPVAEVLGAYPHVALSLADRKKQPTRMKLWQCSHGKKVRATGVVNALCLDCNTPFKRPGVMVEEEGGREDA